MAMTRGGVVVYVGTSYFCRLTVSLSASKYSKECYNEHICDLSNSTRLIELNPCQDDSKSSDLHLHFHALGPGLDMHEIRVKGKSRLSKMVNPRPLLPESRIDCSRLYPSVTLMLQKGVFRPMIDGGVSAGVGKEVPRAPQ